MALKRICMAPNMLGVGGPASFQRKFTAGLTERGIEVCFDLDASQYEAVLVNGGTRHLLALWRAAQRGIPVVQRLNGMNWVHRKKRTGVRHFLKAEYGNLLLRTIRTRIANRIVYQSDFSRRWWEGEQGALDRPTRVIYNGVDLAYYTPDGPGERPEDHYRILLVEGSFTDGYESGLQTAVDLAHHLQDHFGFKVELMIAGKAPDSIRERWNAYSRAAIQWKGLVPFEDIPAMNRSAHLLFSADINAACPNTVIEALACGLPVAAFNTGALGELVRGAAGRVAAYGGDPWQFEPPDVPALAATAVEILGDQPRFRQGARAQAEAHFGLGNMVEGYLEMLNP